MTRVYHYQPCRPVVEGPLGFGYRLNYLRTVMDMSRDALAKKLRCSGSMVRAWEQGLNYPGYWQLLEIGKYFDVNLAWLMGVPGAPREPLKEKAA